MAFTPQDIEEIPNSLSNIFSNLELEIMEDLIMRIKINEEITGAAEWDIYRLIQMGESQRVIKNYIREALKLSYSELENIFGDVFETGYNKDESLYQAAGVEFIQYKDNLELQQLVETTKQQTRDTCKNITNTMGFIKQREGKRTFKPLTQYYKETLDRAVVEVTTGSFSYEKTLKRVVSEMTNSGVRTIDYASGKSTRIEVAARRAVQTAITQVSANITEQNMDALHTDYVEVSWHDTARPTHQVWQGRVFRWNRKDNNSDIEKYKESDIIKAGAVSGARNPYGDAANKHAKKYYGLVRSMTTDVEKIANTTGYSEKDIQSVKNYIFYDKHDLGEFGIKQFEPDYMMGESWRRLMDGKPEPHDLTLIHHEIMEKELIEKGISQDKAHIITSKKYNYEKEAAEYYGKIKKYKTE